MTHSFTVFSVCLGNTIFEETDHHHQNIWRAMHPVLVELGLAKVHTKRNHGRPPRAVDVLQHLLDEKILSEDQVRLAHSSVSSIQSVAQGKASAAEARGDVTKIDQQNSSRPYRTRHIALKFFYDGANYSGLAENVGSETDQSVERALFAALCKAKLVDSRASCGYSRCGRTDRGVSAAGQVVAMRLKSAFSPLASKDEDGLEVVETTELPRNSHNAMHVWVPPRKSGKPRQLREVKEYAYDKILNNLLPPDIRILGWSPVSEEFSARFSATTRTYRYFFLKRNLNLGAMDAALELMVGKHDFRNLCKMDVEKVYNFERVIHSASIVDEGDGICYFLIHGQAFLWHQIRCMASILFYIGRELEVPGIISELFNVEKNPGKPAYPLADELPLVLHNCGYSKVTFGYSPENLWNTVSGSEAQWEKLILTAARLRNNTQQLRDALVPGKEFTSFFQKKFNDLNKRFPSRALKWVDPPFSPSSQIPWGEALEWVRKTYGIGPEVELLGKGSHIPVMQRHKGTTYEEKVAALQKSTKRSKKYQENVIKKRKTKAEDSAFYAHMTEQGGTSM